MKMLNADAFQASRLFIETTARPLEVARFRHAFDGAPAGVVLQALSDFRNTDGGFGQALEPDLRAPESSVLCTSAAFQILRSLETPPDHDLVSSGIGFLLKHLDREQGGWRIIPETADNSPCAPWWCQEDRKESFESFSLNPAAEVLGYLYDNQERVPEESLALVSQRVLRELNGLEKIEMHDLICCLRLLRTTTLPQEYRIGVRTKLKELIAGTVACDPEQWAGYSLRPLQVVDDPQSPFMEGLEDAVAANLDYEIASQNDDGSWTPTWSWDDTFPEAWAKAEKEWSGIITVANLLTLERFGRIEAPNAK